MSVDPTSKLAPEDRYRISADSHMCEPLDLWEKGLPEKFREHAIHLRHEYGSGFYARRGAYEPAPRLQDMARDGILAEVLYPTFAKDMYHIDRPPEAAEACARVYNDWLIEFCQDAPERLWGQAEICLWDVDNAVRELERSRKGGMVGSTIWMVPPEDIPFSSDHYDRFWAASQDLQMPVSMHINTGFGRYGAEVRGTNTAQSRIANLKRTAMGHKQVTADVLTDLICSGVCERFPNLKIIVAEIEVGWIPFWLEEMDKRSRRNAGLQLKPSEYFYRQCYATFTEDPVGGRLLEWYGQDNFMFSTDYPHVGTGDIWLYSDEVIGKNLSHLTPEVRSKVLRDTVATLYGKAIPAPMPQPAPDPSIEEWRQSRTLAGG